MCVGGGGGGVYEGRDRLLLPPLSTGFLIFLPFAAEWKSDPLMR